MFEYAVYAMDYEDAMTHLSFLKSLPKKNLRIFAHLYGMSIEQFESKIDSMLKETSSSFAERRLRLCETDVNPHIPGSVEAALYLYTSVHKRENIGFDDDRIFTFDFDRAEISIEENELLDSYLQVTVRNMDVTVCAGNLSQKFTVSDEICIAMRDVGKLYNLADKFMKYICIRLKSNPFKYLEPKSEGWNVADVMRMFFLLWPVDYMLNDWVQDSKHG